MTTHTGEYSCQLSGSEYREINNDLKNCENKCFSDNKIKHRKICTYLSRNGIRIHLYRRRIKGKSRSEFLENFIYTCVYIINPTLLMDPGNYVDVCHSNDILNMIPMANKLLRSLSPALPLLERCKLTRFDLCVNIKCRDGDEVKDWINILNRAYVPSIKYCQKLIYNKKANKYSYPKNEAKFTFENRVEIEFYNKNERLKNEGLQLEFHDDILRCEIRCFKSYIDDLKHKFDIHTMEEFLASMTEIGYYVFGTQFKKLHLSNEFLNICDVDDKISDSGMRFKTKDRLFEFIQTASRARSLKQCKEYISDKDFTRCIKKLEKLGAVPMPLPYRSTVHSGTNLLELALKYADSKSVGN